MRCNLARFVTVAMPIAIYLALQKGNRMKRLLTMYALILSISMVTSLSTAHQWCWTCNRDNTYGWQIMSPDERKEHQARLGKFTDYNACKEYIDSHHKKMEERATVNGVKLPVMQDNPCDSMKVRGILK